MSKIQDVPFITKVIDTLSDELKSGLYDLIDGQVKTPVFRSLVNNDYAITEANDKGKVQFVTLETLRGNYTGYLAYNSVYCVLIAFKGNTQALDMLNINVAKHTFAFVNESLSILELRVELEDGKKGVTPTDLGVTNNNIHLAKGTTQIGEGVNLKTVGGETIVGSGNVGFKTINDQEIVGDGNIVVGEGGTIAIDTAFDETSTNAVQNKVIAKFANEVVENKANVDGNYPTMTVGNADNANNLIATKGLEVESYFTFEKTGGEQASAIETGNGTLKNLYGKTEKSRNISLYQKDRTSIDLVYGINIANTLKIKGKQNTEGNPFIDGNMDYPVDNGNYSISISGKLADKTGEYPISMTIGTATNVLKGILGGKNDVRSIANFNIDTGHIVIKLYPTRADTPVDTEYDISVNIMLTKTSDVKPYVPYYDGLKHTHIAGVKSAGINQWDEKWAKGSINYDGSITQPGTIYGTSYIRCLPNTTYYSNVILRFAYYDANKTFLFRDENNGTVHIIPSNARFFRITMPGVYGSTYNHDICINFSNPNVNGNYYPYEQDTLDIDFEGNGVGTAHDELDVEEGKKYQRMNTIDMGDIVWSVNPSQPNCFRGMISNIKQIASGVPNLICEDYETDTQNSATANDMKISVFTNTNIVFVHDNSFNEDATAFRQAMVGQKLTYELAEPIVTDVEIPKDTIKVWNGGSMEALGTEIPVGTKIFYQKNIKAFVEAFGEAIDWNPDRIGRLAKLSITPEYVNISLNPSQANAYAVAQVYNATFTIVISTALTGTADSSITFQDSEIDLSSFETKPAESIYDMDGKKVSEEPTTTDCNIASFVGRSYNGIVLWSLLHSGVNKVKVHFEQAIPLDSEGNGKLDCRASLIL